MAKEARDSHVLSIDVGAERAFLSEPFVAVFTLVRPVTNEGVRQCRDSEGGGGGRDMKRGHEMRRGGKRAHT